MQENSMDSAIFEEYSRWKRDIGSYDPYFSSLTIGVHEVLQAHFLLIDFFNKIGEGVGGVGPKNINLLYSALGRQFTEFGGKPKWINSIDVCSTLIFGLIKNHPFHDANKRTSFLVSILHLQKIGRTPTLPDIDYEDFFVDIASNNLKKYTHVDEKLDFQDQDVCISIISRFLKRHTRQIDLRSKVVTYNVLSKLLSHRGFELQNPRHNRIDVVRVKDSDGNILSNSKRVAKIGFRSWSSQASMKDIEILREATKLDAAHGYDAQSFFNGLQDPLSLIKKYREPLKNLAFR